MFSCTPKYTEHLDLINQMVTESDSQSLGKSPPPGKGLKARAVSPLRVLDNLVPCGLIVNEQFGADAGPGVFVVFMDCSLEPCMTLEGGAVELGPVVFGMQDISSEFPLVTGGCFMNHV